MKTTVIILTTLTLLSGSFLMGSNKEAQKISESNGTEELKVQMEPVYEVTSYVEVPGSDVPAVPIVQTAPVYPPELKKNRVQGTVDVIFMVDENGNVIHPTIRRSSNREFNQSSLDAVVQWKYKPALKNGKPVKVQIRQPISYTFRR